MDKENEKLEDALVALGKMSEREIEDISNYIDEIIEYKIEDEKTISNIFDAILSIVFIDDDIKREIFHKLSNYCRKFNRRLADDYDEILEEDLIYDYDEDDTGINYEIIL